MKRHRILGLSLAICVVSQAYSAPLISPEAEAAMDGYVDCIASAAPRLDDGKSDVVIIAQAIKAACASQFSRSLELAGAQMTPEGYLGFRARQQAAELPRIAKVVLRLRASRPTPAITPHN